jgi:hypothetical protein
MKPYYILGAILAVVVTTAAYMCFVKPAVDREDDVIEEVVDCSDLTMSTRRNCLIARDGT